MLISEIIVRISESTGKVLFLNLYLQKTCQQLKGSNPTYNNSNNCNISRVYGTLSYVCQISDTIELIHT